MFLTHSIYLSFAASLFLYTGGDAAPNNDGKCILPNHPPNGKWEIIGQSESKPGSRVPFATVLTFSCDELYKLSEDHSVITCLGESWSSPPVECLRIEKTNKVKRRIKLSRNSNEESSEEDSDEDSSEERRGGGGDGIVIKNDGKRIVIGPGEEGSSGHGGQGGIGVIEDGVIVVGKGGGREEVIGPDGGRRKEVIIVGRHEGHRRTKHKKPTVYYEDGHRGQAGLVIEDGDIVNGDLIGVGQPGRNGGRGEDGIVITGGRINRDIIGIGGRGGSADRIHPNNRQMPEKQETDEERENILTRQKRGGRGGDGVVISGGTVTAGTITGTGGSGGDSGENRKKKRGRKRKNREVQEESQTILQGTEEEREEAIRTRQKRGGRGGDGVVISGGTVTGGTITGAGGRGGEHNRRQIHYQEENREDYARGQNRGYGSQGGRGGDGIVISSGGRRLVIGPGEEGSSVYDQRGVARGGQGGVGVIRDGVITRAEGGRGGEGIRVGGYDGHRRTQPTRYQGGRRGQDGLVIGEGDRVNGYAIGVGQPGRNGGRGGDGIVWNGGRVSGDIVGVGGRGGNPERTYPYNRRRPEEQGISQYGRPGRISGTNGNGYRAQGISGQGGYAYRRKREIFKAELNPTQEVINMLTENDEEIEETILTRQKRDEDDEDDEDDDDDDDGRGGDGVVMSGGYVSGGTITGTGGRGGSRQRKNREVQGYRSITGDDDDNDDKIGDRTILWRQKRGGRGGDGVVISGGDISGGTIKGKGGRGGNRKRREKDGFFGEEHQGAFGKRQKRSPRRGGNGVVVKRGGRVYGNIQGFGGRGGNRKGRGGNGVIVKRGGTIVGNVNGYGGNGCR